MVEEERDIVKEFRAKLWEALDAWVKMANKELPGAGLQSVSATLEDGRPVIYVTKKKVDGSVLKVRVWKGGSGDGAVATIRCVDGEYFKGEVVMTASGPCFRRYDDRVEFPAWALSQHVLTPE